MGVLHASNDVCVVLAGSRREGKGGGGGMTDKGMTSHIPSQS